MITEMETIYIETTIIGHIAGREHSDAFCCARNLPQRKFSTADYLYAR